MKRNTIACVIPNWNGKDTIARALDALLAQKTKADVTVIVVDNGSVDGSVTFIRKKYPDVLLVEHPKNYGFAGGVNGGIKKALELDCDYIALFNNDASAEPDWLDYLWRALQGNAKTAIATGTLLATGGKTIDSTGEGYSVWGLPFPRGRGELYNKRTIHTQTTAIFGASGGASMYRAGLFTDIGLFDEQFFAYYEDVDISFRAQLAGWHVLFVPDAIAYHDIGHTSGKLHGFTTYQTMKNLPMLFFKNVPRPYFWRMVPRFALAYTLFWFSAVQQGKGWTATKGVLVWLGLMPVKFFERWRIQSKRRVQPAYIWNVMTHDLPPNAQRLRKLRSSWHRATKPTKGEQNG